MRKLCLYVCNYERKYMPNILVVEDDDTMRDSIQTILSLNGYNTQAAKDGIDALVNLKSNNPDLIVCDVNMPHLDGYGLLEQLKQNPNTFNIPFVFLTINSDALDRRKGMNLGAEDYLLKPFSTEDLLNSVEMQFRKKKKKSESYLNDNAKSNKIQTIPNEVKAPINGIRVFSEMLRHSANIMTKEDILNVSTLISDSADNLISIMDDYYEYLNVLEKLNNSNFNIDALLPISVKQSIVLTIEKLFLDKNERARDIFNYVNDDLHFKIDNEDLYMLFKNMLQASFKFSHEGQEISILSKLINANTLQIDICNRGRAFSSFEINSINEYLQLNTKENEKQGIGLDLITIKRICELYGIKINISSQKGAFVDIRLTFENT